MKNKLALFFVLFGSFCAPAISSANDDKLNDRYFSQLVLPAQVRNGNVEKSHKAISLPWGSYYSFEEFNQDYPWIAKYYLRSVTPKSGAKWAENINITVGFPNRLEPLNESKTGKVFLFDTQSLVPVVDQDMQAKLADEIAEIQKNLVDSFPFKINFNNSSEGNFRIIFVSDISDWKNTFKRSSDLKGTNSTGFPKQINFEAFFERSNPSLIKFTPNLDNQVEGYFLVNAQGNIDYSVCYIYEGQEDIILSSLIQECIFRGLGFPYEQKENEHSVAFHWNGSGVKNLAHKIEPVDEWAIRKLYKNSKNNSVSK